MRTHVDAYIVVRGHTLIADLEDGGLVHAVEAACCALEGVDGRAEVAVGGEYDGLESGQFVAHLFLFANVLETLEDLRVRELREAQDCATTLNGLDYFRGVVARKRKARGGGVELHGAAHCLLR